MGIFKTVKRKLINLNDIFSKKYIIKNKNIIITGSNSGIGLELVKKLSSQNSIVAMVNESCENLNLTNIEIIKNNFESAKFDQNSIDKIRSFNPHILINCAASFGPKNQEFNQIDINDFQKIININALAPMRLMQYCLESSNLYQITNITSGLGSLSSGHDGGYYYYRTSKVMLNSITKNIACDLKNKKINVFCLQPGNVKTKMNSSGLITPQSSAQKIINILGENNSNFSGKLIDINRNILNW